MKQGEARAGQRDARGHCKSPTRRRPCQHTNAAAVFGVKVVEIDEQAHLDARLACKRLAIFDDFDGHEGIVIEAAGADNLFKVKGGHREEVGVSRGPRALSASALATCCPRRGGEDTTMGRGPSRSRGGGNEGTPLYTRMQNDASKNDGQ